MRAGQFLEDASMSFWEDLIVTFISIIINPDPLLKNEAEVVQMWEELYSKEKKKIALYAIMTIVSCKNEKLNSSPLPPRPGIFLL